MYVSASCLGNGMRHFRDSGWRQGFCCRSSGRELPALLLTAGTLIRIAAGMFSSGRTDYEYLIVLGAQVRGTKITDSLLRRLKKACAYLKEHPDTKVIVSGGRGKGEEIEEARALCPITSTCTVRAVMPGNWGIRRHIRSAQGAIRFFL